MGTRGVPESGGAGSSAAAGSEGRNRRRLDSRALRTAAPILVGHWPFAIAYVLVGRGAGLEAGELLLMSATVFAGASSQLIVVTMMREGIFAVGVLTATTLLVNLRHLLMGASLAPHLERHRFSVQALAVLSRTGTPEWLRRGTCRWGYPLRSSSRRFSPPRER